MVSLRSLLVVLGLSLTPSLVLADEPSVADKAQRRVEEGLLKPLAQRESETSRFSRMRPPPHERRLRVTQPTESQDSAGRKFVSFAVDVRFGAGEWQENDLVGCTYLGTGQIFVKRGDAYRPAAFLLGKSADPVSGVCVASPARS